MAPDTSPSGYPRPTDEQRAAMVTPHMGGGWSGYLSRLREEHRPTFSTNRNGDLVYSGCMCGGLCPIPFLLLHIEDLLDAYNAKVQDFADETRSVAQHRSALQRVLRAMPRDALEGRYRDDPNWHPIDWLSSVLADGFATPVETQILNECHEAEAGAYAWSVTDPPLSDDELLAELKKAIDKRRGDAEFMARLRRNVGKHKDLLDRLADV